MSSVLKILVDIPCQVYCDYEFKGNASPNSMFRLELRKGKYILEFKNEERTLFTKEYEIAANDEDFLLKIDLSKETSLFNSDACSITIANCDSIVKTNANCYIYKKSGKVGLINKDGVILYDCVYDAIDVWDDYIVAQRDGYYIVYDYEGNVVLENCIVTNTHYRNPIHCGGHDFIIPTVVIKEGKYGCLNQDISKTNIFESYNCFPEIKEIIPCVYDFVAYEDKALDIEENYGEEHWPWIGYYFVKKESNGNLHYYKYDCKKDSASLVEDFVLSNPQHYYLFFDTETTGLPINYNAPSSDTNNWPRLVQLAWILTDQNGKRINKCNYIIKPDGFMIPFAASDVHGITTQRAQKEGVLSATALATFLMDFNKASYIVGHNIAFDKKIVGAELIRLGMKDTMDSKKCFCTMQSSIDLCKIPSYNGLGYKYPKLQELHKKLFGSEFDGAHNAMSDIEATEKCFWELRKRGCL